jgi:hypothetical protein
MSGENSNRANVEAKQVSSSRSHAVKSAFRLDHQFFVNLHERLDRERQSANEQHRSILDQVVHSLNEQAVEGSWKLPDDQKPPYSSETIPTVEQLADLVQTAFWASLEKEEGRSLNFAVNFMGPKPTDEKHIAFDEPLSYDVRTLTKLAPAVGSIGATLLVAPFEAGRLKIWGLREYSLAPLRIKAIDPGSVIVTYIVTNVAAISRSEAIHIRDPFMTRNSVIWSRFRPSEDGEKYDHWTDPRIDAILQTVMRMRALGHGGALIIVPEKSEWRDSVQMPIAYSGSKVHNPFRESIPALKELKKKAGHTWAEDQYLRVLMTEGCKRLAHLTAVDGATLVTYDLDVIGFGVKLRSSLDPTIKWQIFSVDPLDHENWFTGVKMEQLGGTRHQSAARFVIEQRDAIAFVVSQDGDVTALVWGRPVPEGALGLYAHRRLELTLF